ncbi:MAG: class I adenylate-forming enzyme family protein [Mycobacteriales bacterium]
MGLHLGRLAEQALERIGDHDSLVFEGRTWRASELTGRARRVTAGLAGLGVRPGDRVAVMMANCPEVLVTYVAVWRAGAVVTPVVFLATATELAHILVDSEATVVVTTFELLAKVTEAALVAPALRAIVVVGPGGAADGAGPAPLVSFADLEQAPPAEVTDRAEDDLAALLYTGGTTGRAKGVMLSHRNLGYCGQSSYKAGRLPGLPRGINPLPLSHAFGMIVTVRGMFAEEGELGVLMRWFDPAEWVRLAAAHQVQRAALVPAMLAMLLAQPLEDADLSALRYVSVGAAPLAPELVAEFERRVPGAEILEGYGCTESGAVISSNRPGARRLGTVGLPIPGYEVRVVDPADRAVPPGVAGEVVVRSPGVMAGYWRAPQESADTLRGGWLHTGDIGILDQDGYLRVIDRAKDLIIRGGFNVFPRDIEDVLDAHPAVAMAGVVGRPDPVLGEEVVAFVALRPGESVTPEELVAFARERIGASKYPREIRIVEGIPLTSVGKLDRKALREVLRRTKE